MQRRTLLKAAAAAALSSTAAAAPAISRRLPDVTVVGAGAFGHGLLSEIGMAMRRADG